MISIIQNNARPLPSLITIVDDDPDAAQDTLFKVEDLGLKGEVISSGSYRTVKELIIKVSQTDTGVLCDHRLQHGGLANFYGSEFVAALYRQEIPAVLVTQYSDQDAGVSIRKYRRYLPVMLPRVEINSRTIESSLLTCIDELSGNVPLSRKPYRAIVRVEYLTEENGEKVADAFIPSWNPHKAVRFPISLMPDKIRTRLERFWEEPSSVHLFAQVNLGAVEAEDLFFYNFEWAEPDDGPS